LHFTGNPFIGSTNYHLNSIPSTHLFAEELLKHRSPPNGTVVSADFQEAGKGQQDKSWFSDPGKNLLLSIIFYPKNLHPSKLFLMNMAVCLAVRKTITAFYPLPEYVQIKWPNDIYLHNKKISGILIKNSINAHKVQNSIISVGININQPSFPDALPNATSLFLHLFKDSDRKRVALTLFSELEKYLACLELSESPLEQEYLECLWGLHQDFSFWVKNKNEVLKGSIQGISETGALMVASSSERKLFHFNHGEIIYL
jgi:BirA family biotin operon repressor/biotin-[acetyl-CoA-carboxylase] ligase